MEGSSQESLNDQDNIDIEWVSGSTLVPASARLNSGKNHTDFRIPLKLITFNKKTSTRIFSSGAGDMAFLVRGKTREVSICLHNMKDEIVINVKEIIELRITKDRCIVLKLNSNFDRTYLYHSEGYPYKENPVRLYKDPTNDHLIDLNCLNLKPANFITNGDLYDLEQFIKTLMAETGQLKKANQVYNMRSLSNNHVTLHNRSIKNDETNYLKEETSMNSKGTPQPYSTLKSSEVTTIQRKEIYITCVIPTQKRAVIYPYDGLLGHFKFYLKQRFGWKWERMWYKNEGSERAWTLLNDEDKWKQIKQRVQHRKLPRLEVFMK